MTRPTDEIEVAKLQERLAVTDDAVHLGLGYEMFEHVRRHIHTLMTDAIKEVFDKIRQEDE